MTTGVLSGPRVRLGRIDPSTGVVRYFGIYESCSFGMQYDVQPVFLLGRWTAAALEYTAVEPVNISCTGWRVVGHGAHTDGGLPRVQDLLTADYQVLTLHDRKTNQTIATIRDVRPTGYSTGYAARQLTQMSVSYLGILVDDELTDNSEPADSTFLPL